MTVEEKVLERLRGLPPEKRVQVLNFADLLFQQSATNPRQSLRGLWKGLGIEISDEDIAQARRQMWSDFPRDVA